MAALKPPKALDLINLLLPVQPPQPLNLSTLLSLSSVSSSHKSLSSLSSLSSRSALTTALGQQRRRLLRLPAVASQLPIQMPPRRAQVAVTSEQADLPAQRFAEAAPS